MHILTRRRSSFPSKDLQGARRIDIGLVELRIKFVLAGEHPMVDFMSLIDSTWSQATQPNATSHVTEGSQRTQLQPPWREVAGGYRTATGTAHRTAPAVYVRKHEACGRSDPFGSSCGALIACNMIVDYTVSTYPKAYQSNEQCAHTSHSRARFILIACPRRRTGARI